MKVYRLDLEELFFEEEEVKCPECNWEITIGYTLGQSREEAEAKAKAGEFFCGNCLGDFLVDNDCIIFY